MLYKLQSNMYYFVVFIVFLIKVCIGESNSSLEMEFITNKEVYTSCYDELGCIITNSSWCSLLHRPVVMKADERHIINTTFILHTRNPKSHSIKSTFLNVSTIDAKQFTPNVNTIVIVHGYLSSGQASWVVDLATSVLKRGFYNVIAVDWMMGAYKFYPVSVSNTRIVALELTHLLSRLLSKRIIKSPENLHLIGHSLGAHICGYVGENIPKIKRITGLDPAGPYFQSMPNFVKLDPSDAEKVIVLHTDPSTNFLTGYGTAELSGHIDIFANNIATTQPGCFGRIGGPLSDFITVSRITVSNFASKIRSFIRGKNYTEKIPPYEKVSCSHSRSIDYFIEAISSNNCDVVPFECDFFADFIEGKCNGCGNNYEKCIKFDLQFHDSVWKRQGRRKFLFFTGRQKPFCVTTYSVSMKLTNETIGCSGTFDIVLHSDKGEKTGELSLNSGHKVHFEPGDKIHTLTFNEKSIANVTKVDFVWKSGIFQKLGDFFRKHKKQLVIEYIEIQNMGMIPHSEPIMLCPQKVKPIHLGKMESFSAKYCKNKKVPK